VSLLSRALEIEGIPAAMTTWRDGVARMAKAPRATFTKLPRGSSVGAPHDPAQQRRVLAATLALLAQEAPLEPTILKEEMEGVESR
jgi:D-proline reductase (dithiol) PrdA